MAVVARINAINVPGEADPGSPVEVQVSVQRIGPSDLIACAVEVNGEYKLVTPGETYLAPNEIQVFTTSFIMPSTAAVVTAQSMYYDYEAYGWVLDDTRSATVGLAEPPPPPPEEYVLTTSVVGNGSVLPSSGVYNQGDQIILLATPDLDNVFLQWSGDIDGAVPVPGMPNNLQVTMDRDRHIVAEFEGVAPPAEYSGKISRKELEYDHIRSGIPVY